MFDLPSLTKVFSPIRYRLNTMANPKLCVVFYRPRYGNYHHWAL
jgi:hypothetical protein